MAKRHVHPMVRWFSALLIVSLLISLPTATQAAETEDDYGFGNQTIMVSLGDSYASGEGIEPFYDQTLPLKEKVKSQDWLAHRSQNSWSGMLTLPGVKGTMSQNRNSVWYFVASSGAVTKNLNQKQEGSGKYYDKDLSLGKDLEGQGSIDPQLDIFKSLPQNEVDYVTMSIGGNDADFSGIITKAFLGTAFLDFSGLEKTLNGKLEQLKEGGSLRKKLMQAYKDVEAAAGKQATILITGYPCLLERTGDGMPFSQREANLINDAVSKFNDAIEEFVAISRSGGMNIHFVDIEDAFYGHEAYSKDPYINKVILNQQAQDLKDHDPLGASAYSVHPNYKGACTYAQCVQAKINQLEAKKQHYSPHFSLSVYDYAGDLCDDFTLQIEGRTQPFILGMFEEEYNKTLRVNQASPLDLDLPQGEYTLTIVSGRQSYSEKITVKNSGQKTSMVCNTSLGFDPTWGGILEDWIDEPIRTTSEERDVVLVLDVSGSMGGDPISETKKAAENFIETVLQQDASIGIVTYSYSASQLADFSIDEEYLKNCVNDLHAYGGTNIDDGLSMAHEMLQSSTAKKKIIVVMSDGQPTDGRQGTDLIAFSDEIKEDGITIYSLGFFDGLGSDKASAQMLMEGIASDGCHYEVSDADDLVFFFEDMADQINGVKYIYVRIACPVEVSVTYEGEILDSTGAEHSQRTSFGTLTFEANPNATSQEDSRIKILRLKEGAAYDVQITGTGRGLMDYTIGFMDDDGIYSDLRTFEDIKISKKTVISTVASTSNSTTLNVDEDGDGKYDIRYRAGENGLGEPVSGTWILWVLIPVLAIAGITILLIIKKRKRGHQHG